MPEEETPREIQFDDIAGLADREIQRILREVDSKDLRTQRRIFSNVSERAGAMLREEMAISGPVRREEVEDIRWQIGQVMRGLVASEEVAWPPSQVGSDLERAGGTEVSHTARERSRASTKPPRRARYLIQAAGGVGGVALGVLLLMWLSEMNPGPSRSDKKKEKPSPSASSRRQEGATKRQNREQDAQKQPPKERASEKEKPAASSMDETEGEVYVISGNKKRPAGEDKLRPGDVVETGADGKAEIDLWKNSGQVEVDANSRLEVGDQTRKEDPLKLNLRMGDIRVEVKDPALEVKSPLAKITGAKGAEYRLQVALDATTTVSVERGTVRVKALVGAQEQTLVLTPGDEVKIDPSGRVVEKRP